MQPEIIQSLIHLNRNTIRELHQDEAHYTSGRKFSSEVGMHGFAEQHHKALMKTKKQIAQLVKIQKALKWELASSINDARFEALFKED